MNLKPQIKDFKTDKNIIIAVGYFEKNSI